MATLKENRSKSSAVKGTLTTLWDELQDVDENYAQSYINWCLEKLKTNKRNWEETKLKRVLRTKTEGSKEYTDIFEALIKVAHRNLPKNISKGDIVHIRFGINLGDELSDLDKNQINLSGHYGIVLAQKGFMFLVIPLTSQPKRNQDPDLLMTLSDLGLPGANVSYLSFGKIKSVHIRRINRIHSILEGKISLPSEKIKELESKMVKFLALQSNSRV